MLVAVKAYAESSARDYYYLPEIVRVIIGQIFRAPLDIAAKLTSIRNVRNIPHELRSAAAARIMIRFHNLLITSVIDHNGLLCYNIEKFMEEH